MSDNPQITQVAMHAYNHGSRLIVVANESPSQIFAEHERRLHTLDLDQLARIQARMALLFSNT